MRVLIVAQSEQDLRINRVRKVSTGISEVYKTEVAFLGDAAKTCSNTPPFLVIVLLPSNPGPGFEFIHRLREHYEGYVLAVSSSIEQKAVQRALQMGADAVLDEVALEMELEPIIWKLLGRRPLDENLGQCLCLVSAGGGCGASTLAVNIGAAVATKYKECALIDMNAQWGDLPALLDLKSEFNLVDLCRAESRLDPTMLDKSMVRHRSGIRLLGSPYEASAMKRIPPKGIQIALDLIRKWCRYTIVDLADVFEAEQTEVLRQATGVLLVGRLTFCSINKLRRLLKHFGELGIHSGRVKIVINHHGQPNELQLVDAEQALGIKLLHLVPFDPKIINTANNTGEPAVLREPTSRVAKCMSKLASLGFEV